ncbi:MAG: DegV family protein [Clostridia bacterium]|nr:DegV family protein [Clostridia bacterium]
MRDYVILTDSGTDLSPAKAEELGVRVIDLMVIMEGGEPTPNRDVDPKEFYAFLRSKKMATTSAINVETFTNIMEEIVKEGKDVLYMGFSSGLSATYSAGRLAAEEVAAKYPDSKVLATDTLCASLGQGLFVYHAAKMQKAGASIDEVYEWAEQNKLHLCHWFTVNDLMFLKRGGRVSAATAVMGTMLNIKPVMHVDNEGHLVKMSTARGRKASIDALFEKFKETAIDGASQTIFICHGDCIDDANYLADRLKKEAGVKEIFIDYTGVVIGAHSGPGTLAIFYLGTER